MTWLPRQYFVLVGVGVLHMLSFPQAGQGQGGPPITVHDLVQIFASGGDSPGWDEFDVPEFVAAAYGRRAKSAIETILRQPSSVDNYYLQLEALTTARYARVDVSMGLLMEYVNGERGGNSEPVLQGILRRRALTALTMRPDPALGAFWLQRMSTADVLDRQTAAAGLACSLGAPATPHLMRLEGDADTTVARVAKHYGAQIRSDGDRALACGGRVSRRDAPGFPSRMPDRLRDRARAILERVP
jgi:hypothetical protein